MTKEQVAWELRWQLGRLGIDTSGFSDEEVIEFGVKVGRGILGAWERVAEEWRQARQEG